MAEFGSSTIDLLYQSAQSIQNRRPQQPNDAIDGSNLSNEDIDNLAAYFSSQKPAKAGGDPTLAKAGESKASICLGCHGQSAEGNGQFPRLAGQHPEYLEQQLKNFKDGSRKSGPMQAITANLSETDFKALAAYFGSL